MSRETTGVLGDRKMEHFDADGKCIGTSRPETGTFGDEMTAHHNSRNEKTGVFGGDVAERFDRKGTKTGETR